MAWLKQVGASRRLTLSARNLVGRAAHCVLRPTDARVSGEHASIVWTGIRWEIRDLGSRNGTFVDGERLEPREPRALELGAALGWGTGVGSWSVADLGPPIATAHPLSNRGTVQVAEDGLLALPSPTEPRVTVFEDLRGGWLGEFDGEQRPVIDGETVCLDDTTWRLSLPVPLEPTIDASAGGGAIDQVQLRVGVSRDEEHVELSLGHAGRWESLGARAHHHLILTLARARLADQELPDLSAGEHGWRYVDEVCRMLAIEDLRLNTEIYRARKELLAAGVQGASQLVERRRSTRSLRLGTAAVEVVPLS
ncbi:MAG: FHA domain-containing protein [Nannocystaceae bacterium]|nr:FHA domain-containing protein [Nannocystaceae bacterium]